MEQKKHKPHSAEFRIEIAQRMLAGENVMAMCKRYGLARSMMYRWRDAYRKNGPEALARRVGHNPKIVTPSRSQQDQEEALKRRIAELERKVGQQTIEIDFFRAVFKRLEEQPKTSRRGGELSTPRSEE